MSIININETLEKEIQIIVNQSNKCLNIIKSSKNTNKEFKNFTLIFKVIIEELEKIFHNFISHKIICPNCGSFNVKKNGFNVKHNQKYRCRDDSCDRDSFLVY